MRSATVQARVDVNLKHEAELILEDMGLKLSDAISIYLKQIVNTGSIPFEIKASRIPNRETRQAIEDANNGRDLTRTKSTKDLFKKLGI
ncbi:MAG: type II toxin-antitoxin system RelB/DinJ family antitoxin [Gammaproteobacteria bacterium]|nr:type II toxin-antitoxin system RelB/DinJ family antitoxin [Gammaproteobacteria bacterium]